MICVYYAQIKEELHESLIQKYLLDFPIDFQHKVLRYRRWQDAQLSLLGRLLLRHGMRQILHTSDDIIIKYSYYKKPYLEDKRIKFNISHSGKIVVCAITTFEDVGVDVEQIRPIDVRDFKKQMTDYEWWSINSSENTRSAFYDYWTQKEAVIKANGKGLSIPLNSFQIVNCQSVLDNELFSVTEINIDENYKCHLAIKGDFNSQMLLLELVQTEIQ